MENKIPQIGTKEFNDLASDCFGGKPKQETLEEAAKNYIYKPQNNDYGDYNSFIAGAKWQQERSYSEEDMRECWMACLGFNKPEKFNSRVKFEEWFETFSK